MKTNQAVEGLVAAVMLGLVTNAPAMPSKQEINKAQPLVAELMAPAMDDYKAKKKTAAEVADAAVAFAAETETEAAKFMLYRSSIPYYVRGEAYDKAAEAVTLLKSNVKDVPAEVVAEIISKATVRANKEKAPRLFELYRQAKMQVTAEKDVRELRKKPASPANRRKLAEALATAGDWTEALKEFADLGNDAAQMAKRERDGSGKSYELGEFWWGYKPTYANAEDNFKIPCGDALPQRPRRRRDHGTQEADRRAAHCRIRGGVQVPFGDDLSQMSGRWFDWRIKEESG